MSRIARKRNTHCTILSSDKVRQALYFVAPKANTCRTICRESVDSEAKCGVKYKTPNSCDNLRTPTKCIVVVSETVLTKILVFISCMKYCNV